MKYQNKILLKNTIAQYLRIIISIIGTLISTRIVLAQLGISDYGIFSVLAGFIALFGILNNSMIVAVQRFLSYEIPLNNNLRLNQIYSTSIIIHLIIATIVVILCETVGLYFVKTQMTFASGKLDDAIFVFHCVVISFAFNIISIPQQGTLIAYEKIFLASIVNIIETLLKLFAAILLMLVTADKLILYAIFYVIISIIIRILYTLCVKHYISDLKFQFRFNKQTCKELTGFASWNLLGAIANVGKVQGVNILLNLFFNTVVNAAYGIANQINSQLLFFSSSIFQSSNSQIVQSFRLRDGNRLQFLVFQSSKFAFILYFIVTLFVFSTTEDLLFVWLDNVPEYCSIFVKLMVVNSCIELFSSPLMLITQATGQIRNYFIVISSVMILILPISYVFLQLGYNPYIVLYVSIVINIILLIIRMIFVKNSCNFIELNKYLTQVILPAFLIMIITCSTIPYISLIPNIWMRIMAGAILSPLSVIILSYLFLLTKHEKNIFNGYAIRICKKFHIG